MLVRIEPIHKTEDSDWKTQFTPKEIVYKICEIIEKDI